MFQLTKTYKIKLSNSNMQKSTLFLVDIAKQNQKLKA